MYYQTKDYVNRLIQSIQQHMLKVEIVNNNLTMLKYKIIITISSYELYILLLDNMLFV